MDMYRKAIVAVVAALSILVVCLEDGALNATEVISVVIAFLGAFGVERVSNAE